MTWLLWRQYRIMALIAAGVLVLTIAFLLISGWHGITTGQQLGLAACAHQRTNHCVQVLYTFYTSLLGEQLTTTLVLPVLPVLVGLFLGAPLIAREWEQGTYRLAWTQSINRSRWLTHRLSILLLVILLVAIIPALLAFWWSDPYTVLSSVWTNYDIKGIVPVAYTLFAFALGVASGTLLRKTISAMAVTLVLFVIVRLVIAIVLRPYFIPPLTTNPIDVIQNVPLQVQQGMMITTQYVDRQGRSLSANEAIDPCINETGDLNQCMHDHGVHYYFRYQPAERFWLFQGIEFALYLVLIVGLLSLTTWLVRRRLC